MARATARVVNLGNLTEQKRALWRPVLQQTGHPRVRGALAEAVRNLPLQATRDPVAVARAIQLWVQRHVRYLREYPETYQTPARTLEWGIGDCDDHAPLVSAMARTARIPSRLVIVGWGDRPEQSPWWRHIYSQMLLPKLGWTSAETVRSVPLGFDAGTWKGSKGLEVKRAYVGDRGELR